MYQATVPCSKCGAQNLRGTWVCAHCGSTLLVYCPSCHAGNASGSQFCQSCGRPLTSSGAAQPYAQSTPTQHHNYQQPGYGAQDPQQQYQQYPGGYPPPYDTGQQSPPGGGDILRTAQGYLGGFTAKVKQIVSTTNPMLLSALVILVVGMVVFSVVAVQLGWIKTSQPVKTAAVVKDKTPPMMSMVQITAGSSPNSAIISWVTDKYSSSQVKYGVYPYANTITPMQDDPTTGTNRGALMHSVGLTSLIGNSTYVYQCISIDKDGNQAITPEVQFQTTR
jgi:hypothetical protein